MFDLITGSVERPLRERAPGSKVASVLLHVSVLTVVVGIPLRQVARGLPAAPTVMAFVAPTPVSEPPPPPLPPAPPIRATAPKPGTPAPPVTPGTLISALAPVAPIETPREMSTEGAPSTSASGDVDEGGVSGGIEGGVTGGVIGGIASAVGENVALPAAPPPPPVPKGPVRVGGQIKTPALLHRVEPIYPDLAAAVHLAGTVILEAVVASDGCVSDVKVLRPVNVILDNAAVAALKEWRYSPLVLNGIAMPFVLTVTFTFSTK